jgi:hypothetical protein
MIIDSPVRTTPGGLISRTKNSKNTWDKNLTWCFKTVNNNNNSIFFQHQQFPACFFFSLTFPIVCASKRLGKRKKNELTREGGSQFFSLPKTRAGYVGGGL